MLYQHWSIFFMKCNTGWIPLSQLNTLIQFLNSAKIVKLFFYWNPFYQNHFLYLFYSEVFMYLFSVHAKLYSFFYCEFPFASIISTKSNFKIRQISISPHLVFVVTEFLWCSDFNEKYMPLIWWKISIYYLIPKTFPSKPPLVF